MVQHLPNKKASSITNPNPLIFEIRRYCPGQFGSMVGGLFVDQSSQLCRALHDRLLSLSLFLITHFTLTIWSTYQTPPFSALRSFSVNQNRSGSSSHGRIIDELPDISIKACSWQLDYRKIPDRFLYLHGYTLVPVVHIDPTYIPYLF